MKGAVIIPVRTRALRLHPGGPDIQGPHDDQENDDNHQDTGGEKGNPEIRACVNGGDKTYHWGGGMVAQF